MNTIKHTLSSAAPGTLDPSLVILIMVLAVLVFALTQLDVSQLGVRGARIMAWLDPEAYASGSHAWKG